MKDFGYKNPMQVPKLEKIVVNMGLGEAINNNKLIEQAEEQLMAISGQKAVVTRSRKSIANFKLRENQAIGCMVTLRKDALRVLRPPGEHRAAARAGLQGRVVEVVRRKGNYRSASRSRSSSRKSTTTRSRRSRA